MWASGALGHSSPEVLLNIDWCLLTLHMGLRGDEQTYSDFAI